MDRSEFLDLLKRHDDTVHGEWPGGWNTSAYHAAERKFLALAEEVQQVLGESPVVEHGGAIQDASFHGLLALPKSCLVNDYKVSLRVSNFGNLATLYDADDMVKSACRDKVKDVLARRGYIYVPSWVLNEPYPPQVLLPSIPNWGVRYFDYL